MKFNTEKPEFFSELQLEKPIGGFASVEPIFSSEERQRLDEDLKHFEARAKYMLEVTTKIAQEDMNRRAEDARFDESRTTKNESHDYQHNTSKHSTTPVKDILGNVDETNTD